MLLAMHKRPKSLDALDQGSVGVDDRLRIAARFDFRKGLKRVAGLQHCVDFVEHLQTPRTLLP